MPRDRSCKPVTQDPRWADWEIPVVVKAHSHRQEVVTNPAEALAFLLVQWRGEKNEEHEAARVACSGVFRRRVSPEDARVSFVHFAQGAGLLD